MSDWYDVDIHHGMRNHTTGSNHSSVQADRNIQEYPGTDRSGGRGADRWTIALFAVYLVVLAWILLLKLGVRFSYMDRRSLNLVPFREGFIPGARVDFAEIMLNMLIFVPLGIYTAILFRSWYLSRCMLFIFATSLLIEGVQYALRIGAFDITDLITNTLGGLAGLLLVKLVDTLTGNSRRSQKLVNVLLTFGTAFIVLFLLLLKLNMLPIRYQ